MNKTHHIHILAGTILCALAAAILPGCNDEFEQQTAPDFDTMIREGKYLRARNAETALASADPESTTWFPIGTPYRLLVYVKPDPGTSGTEAAQSEPATHARFNRVTQEAEANGFRYIDIEGNADILFGFTPLGDETGGVDGRVSLDFYGFTYGAEADRAANYIEIDGLSGETRPDDGTLETLKRTERVTDGKLADLRHGKLLNRTVATVNGKAAFSQQSAVPFSHCFSRLEFSYVQQPEADGVTPYYKNLYIDDVQVTGTYNEGSVYLQTGKVELPETDSEGNVNRVSRTLSMTTRASVPVRQTELGEMLIFPSDGQSLTTGGDGYEVGLDITLKSPEEKVINNFLVRSGSADKAVKKDDGYWYGVVRKSSMIHSRTNGTLYFASNTRYILVISLQENTVRVITVIPQVEDWINGEWTGEQPWQRQHLGQPQMFDNIIWSDRNLGADDFDPTYDYEGTVGYFYQAGRNIPYFPFDATKYANVDRDGADTALPVPTPWDKRTGSLAGESSYKYSVYRLYPMVDPEILKMKRQRSGKWESVGSGHSDMWTIWPSESDFNPQMKIPESQAEAGYFDFVYHEYWPEYRGDMGWYGEPQKQPVSGSWQVPTSADYMSIFPTTPLAGNITFRRGGDGGDPMHWDGHGTMNERFKTLRVTVPYYKDGMAEPTGKSDKYMEAWYLLHDKRDIGTTHEDENAYCSYQTEETKKDENGNPMLDENGNEIKEWVYFTPWRMAECGHEPDGDPEDGFASVYVISRDPDTESLDKLPLDIADMKDPENRPKFTIKEWGRIYGIKRIYTNQAYRMRWRVMVLENPLSAPETPADLHPGMYVEICRYRCNQNDGIDETNYMTYDWEHPAAKLYFPICGLGDFTGSYINFGTECMYATSDPIVDGKTGAVQIKITGDDDHNEYIAVVKKLIKRTFGMQIRPVGWSK